LRSETNCGPKGVPLLGYCTKEKTAAGNEKALLLGLGIFMDRILKLTRLVVHCKKEGKKKKEMNTGVRF